VLLSGDWNLDVSLDGAAAPAPVRWEAACWISDEDVDYLELQTDLSPKVRVQRQIVMARKDGFVMMADVVMADVAMADAARALRCRARWATPAGAKIRLARETREAQWLAPRPCGLLLPLALPEWRLERRGGELTCEEGAIELTRESPQARALYSPLFLDLRARRCKKPATWRQLTIAETRIPVPADAAAAFRVQVDKEQWLFYRALDGRGNRTVLGHNLVSEFLTARFERSGKTKAVVEIE
jgi:hypothetical protein